ncbi:hypothetical protein MPSEU_000295800 [Mayamaea pseudoterrestris]|nr:hypothetical protein MPSEU_000295800 [Mayamaea pseudoterrestris]
MLAASLSRCGQLSFVASRRLMKRPSLAVRSTTTTRRHERLHSTYNDENLTIQKEPHSSRFVSYLTDVEGDRDYLTRFVKQSRVLTFRPISECDVDQTSTALFPYDHCIDFINDRDMLVFGGDAWDQGGSDLYVMRQLLSLKERYVDRVHLVVGNRDVNKMRMHQELGSLNDIAAPPHQGVYWLAGTGREGDPNSGLWLSTDPVKRLQWMLRDTMGSPRAFEYRRCELEEERYAMGQSDAVSDLDVVESYKRSTDPVTGEMSRYLSQAELAVKLGDALFIHGALPLTPGVIEAYGDASESIWSDMTFAMPWLPTGLQARCDTIYEWFAGLNKFLHDSVDAWKNIEARSDDPLWAINGGYRPYSSYSNLVQYGMGGLPGGPRGNNPTIVYQGWTSDGMPRRFFDDTNSNNHRYVNHVRDFFQRADIKLICSGHQPQGDMPNTIRVDIPGDATPAFIVCADTSYSGDTKWLNESGDCANSSRHNFGRGTARSGRGNTAVTEVLIEQSQRTSRVLDVFSHGVMSDGTSFETCGLYQDLPADFVVGTAAAGLHLPPQIGGDKSPWWTKAALKDGSFLMSTGKEYDCWNYALKLK